MRKDKAKSIAKVAKVVLNNPLLILKRINQW